VTAANLDPPGPTIVYVNPAFERMTGWSAAEILGRSPRVMQGPETDLSIFAGMRAAILRGHRWEGQAVNYRKDGTKFFMEWSITPLLRGDGRPTHYVAVQRDVTARIEAERRIAEAREQAREADRRKANLARYFSPSMAEALAQRDHPLGVVRRQDIAILFIDIVGFTPLTERVAPERVVAMLRSFYRRMAQSIFAHGGSVERFAGDALMALFGVPNPSGREAGSALRASFAMMAELDRWNEKRANAGRRAIETGISVNYGTAVLGDIGTRESMSFTAIGDAVNTASRMQELCRRLGARLVASQALVERASSEGGVATELLARLRDAGSHGVRGRQQSIHIWAERAP
jgi:PAS domain S-box-containing protein